MSKQTKPAKSGDDFIPDDVVSSGSANYMKLVVGENKIRIISKPAIGWLEWIDKKPTRTQIGEQPDGQDDENPPKKFMALVVIDRDDNEVKVMELTQQSVIKAIKALSANPDWGNPFSYDITIKKSGEGMKTKYVVTPSPKKPLEKALVKAAQDKPCNLDALYDYGDPFAEDQDEYTEYQFK